MLLGRPHDRERGLSRILADGRSTAIEVGASGPTASTSSSAPLSRRVTEAAPAETSHQGRDAPQVGRFPPNRLHPFYFGCETVSAVDEE
jgi:hypothetical protein